MGCGVDWVDVGFFAKDVLGTVVRCFAGAACRYAVGGNHMFLFGLRVWCVFFACVFGDRRAIVGFFRFGDVVGLVLLVAVFGSVFWSGMHRAFDTLISSLLCFTVTVSSVPDTTLYKPVIL